MQILDNPLIKKMDKMNLVDALWWFIADRNRFEHGDFAEALNYLKGRVDDYRDFCDREMKRCTNL